MAEFPGRLIIESEADAVSFLSDFQEELDGLGLVIVEKSTLTEQQLAQVKTFRAKLADEAA